MLRKQKLDPVPCLLINDRAPGSRPRRKAFMRKWRLKCRPVEVKYVLQAGDILAVHLRDAPHVLAPRLEVVLGQAPAYGLAGEAAVLGEPDESSKQGKCS
jgi:hypothetical protein